MINQNKVVLGIYPGRSQLEKTIFELKACGFRNADVSALVPSTESTKQFAHVNSTKLPEAASTGGAAGALLGGALGWLVGIGSMTIPGLGAFVAAGPIMSLLAGAGIGTTVGGVTGALIGIGLPEYEAKRYEGFVREGGYLLSVHCDNAEWVERAKETLRKNGAQEISCGSEANSDSHQIVSEDIPRSVGNS